MKRVYIIAGPNGSGKTLMAKELAERFKLPFLNADEIALNLAPDGNVKKVRIQAGKIFLRELQEYISRNESFIVETTLAGRYFIRIINQLKKRSYKIVLIYIFLESVEEAINKIRLRVKKGGHSVPDEDVKRRFDLSKRNFWNIYKSLADNWKIIFNVEDNFIDIAIGEKNRYNISDDKKFELFWKSLITLDGI